MNTKTLSLIIVSGLYAAVPTPAAAQSFVNGGFQSSSSTLLNWTVANTTNGVGAPGSVTVIDIDGPGPFASSNAATFQAGQATFQTGVYRGVDMTQTLMLTAGTLYVVNFDWSAQKFAGANAAEGGTFSLVVGGAIIAQGSAGATGISLPRYGHVTGTFTPSVSGPVSVGVRVTRPFTPAADLFQYVDNVTILAAPAATPLGALPVGSTIANGTLVANQVRWYTFTIPAVASPAYLDIDTEGSALAPSNDTELGLYTVTGNLIATDDDDGSGFLSQLSFGNTSPRPSVGGVLYDGRDGPLAAGTYFLAVAGFNSTFGATNWNVVPGATNIGNFRVKLALGNDVATGACCAPAGTCSISTQAACGTAGGAYRGDGTDCGTPCPQAGACCLPLGTCSVLSGAHCTAAGGVFRGVGTDCAAANCPTVLFDAGRGCAVTFNGNQTFTGFSSGNIVSQGFPQRWAAQAFTLPQASRIRNLTVVGFVPTGSEFTTMNFIVWRRTGANRPVEGDQVATGAMPLPVPVIDPRLVGASFAMFGLPVDFNLAAGDYYLTVYASGEVTQGADANFAWLANAQLDPNHPGAPNKPIVVSDAQGVFMWRSGTMPSPGFERHTNAAIAIAPNPAHGPNPQNPDYIFNASFTVLGEVLSGACYANCDGSTGSPRLTANDFACFLNAYANNQPYANCDSTGGLTPNDFQCFLNAFAAGCP